MCQKTLGEFISIMRETGDSSHVEPASDRISAKARGTAHACNRGPLAGAREPDTPHRLKLWEVRSNTHCSVIGTCLTETDLLGILKRCRLSFDKEVAPYQLHSYVVQAVSTDGAIARAVQKLLDRRHEGMLRVVGRTRCGGELAAIWDREFQAGRVAGVFWAMQTWSHIPEELFFRLFGEVHMLSHVLGRTVHATAARASEFEARIADLEARLARQRDRHSEALGARDREIARLTAEATRPRAPDPVSAAASLPRGRFGEGRGRQLNSRRDSALVSARERARAAEARVGDLMRENERLRRQMRREQLARAAPATPPECPGAAACRLHLPAGEKLHVLYLGGRSGAIDRLRAIAEGASAEFLYHDGGEQESCARIPELVARAHVVFCPVDCVSHRACLAAKDHCRRLCRTFIPLRSAGGTTFERALRQIEVVGPND